MTDPQVQADLRAYLAGALEEFPAGYSKPELLAVIEELRAMVVQLNTEVGRAGRSRLEHQEGPAA